MNWKDVVGYEGLYQVSDTGFVRSLGKLGSRQNGGKKERILTPQKPPNGYRHVTLSKDNKPKQISVHRLVAEHFMNNDGNKPFVNHKDLDKTNNHVNNLEWCTQKENVQHAIANGKQGGRQNGKRKLLSV